MDLFLMRLLPENKKFVIDLDFLCKSLVANYTAIEKLLPKFVDPGSSNDKIYESFEQSFSRLKTASHNLKLKFIPNIYKEPSKAESSKRPRSESTNDPQAASKTPRK
jgi:hypothetical protein